MFIIFLKKLYVITIHTLCLNLFAIFLIVANSKLGKTPIINKSKHIDIIEP